MTPLDFLDSHILQFINDALDNNNRKNSASAHYWYPLNYASYGAEEITSALQSMLSFSTSMSNKCRLFETSVSQYIDRSYSIFCNSGSSADLLATTSLVKSPDYNIVAGDYVLVPAVTWPTQIWSIIQAGLIPVLFDCDPESFNPDIKSVSVELLQQCKAVFITHILGTSCDMHELLEICEKYDLLLLEDSCESLGAKFDGKHLGTFGLISTYSTFFSHHITTMEGGICTTNSEDLAIQMSILRAHGWTRSLPELDIDLYLQKRGIDLSDYDDIDARYLFIDQGYNLRPTEITASFGIQQLKKLPDFIKQRNKLSSYFYSHLAKLSHLRGPILHPKLEPCYMSLPVSIVNSRHGNRYAMQFLESRGVETRPLIAGNISKHPALKHNPLQACSSLDGADYHHNNSFYLGLSPQVSIAQIDRLLRILYDLDTLL